MPYAANFSGYLAAGFINRERRIPTTPPTIPYKVAGNPAPAEC